MPGKKMETSETRRVDPRFTIWVLKYVKMIGLSSKRLFSRPRLFHNRIRAETILFLPVKSVNVCFRWATMYWKFVSSTSHHGQNTESLNMQHPYSTSEGAYDRCPCLIVDLLLYIARKYIHAEFLRLTASQKRTIQS